MSGEGRSGSAALRLDLSWRRGDLTLEVALDVGPGEVVAVLGPNGAGKSSLFRAIAGLDDGPTGSIEIDGRRVLGPGVDVAASERGVGVVFQDHLLFPHLTVLDNVAFGPRCAGVSRSDARRRAADRLERTGLAALRGRLPAELSGGQAQRVAIARALAAVPGVLLLDEPLAALDATTRHEVRRDLRRALDDHPGAALVITHDPLDAFALADRAVVLEAGRIVQSGTLEELSLRPRSAFVADLLGVNVLRGTIASEDSDATSTSTSTGRLLDVDGGGRLVVASAHVAGGERPVAAVVPGDRVFAAIRPAAVTVHRTRPAGSVRNVWSGTVTAVDPLGDRVRLHVDGAPGLVAEVTAPAVAELDLARGSEVWLAVKATDVDVYPA